MISWQSTEWHCSTQGFVVANVEHAAIQTCIFAASQAARIVCSAAVIWPAAQPCAVGAAPQLCTVQTTGTKSVSC